MTGEGELERPPGRRQHQMTGVLTAFEQADLPPGGRERIRYAKWAESEQSRERSANRAAEVCHCSSWLIDTGTRLTSLRRSQTTKAARPVG